MLMGYCAYDKVDTAYLEKRLKAFLPDIVLFRTSVNRFKFFKWHQRALSHYEP